MALTATGVLAFLLPIVMCYKFEFLDTSRESYSIGDDVTLTCPITLCPGEEYKSVEWTYFSCGRYHFRNYCYNRAFWNRTTYSGPNDIPLTDTEGMTMQVPADRSVKPTLTIKSISCDKSAYYHCRVIGTKGTDREHRHDVYLFRNASAEPKLTPDSIIIPQGVKGPKHFMCVDEAHTPGSSIRMYYGFWSLRAAFTEVPTTCMVTYLPNVCHQLATCRASFEMSTLRHHGTIANTVHCDITRPGGRRVDVNKQVQILGETLGNK